MPPLRPADEANARETSAAEDDARDGGRNDDDGMVRRAQDGAPRPQSVPGGGVLQGVRGGDTDARAGVGTRLAVVLPDLLVPPHVQRHSLAMRRARGQEGLRAPSARGG